MSIKPARNVTTATENVRVQLTPAQVRLLDQIRDEVLTSPARGYIVEHKKECEWMRERRMNPLYAQAVAQLQDFDAKMVYWRHNTAIVPYDFILEQIMKGEVDGIAFVDIYRCLPPLCGGATYGYRFIFW